LVPPRSIPIAYFFDIIFDISYEDYIEALNVITNHYK
jgi:hypothetical protein